MSFPAGRSGWAATTYCNPLNLDYGYTPIPNFSQWGRPPRTADPVIVNYKGDYYLFSTNQWVIGGARLIEVGTMFPENFCARGTKF